METVEVLLRIPKQDFDFIKDEFADGDMPDEKDLKETTYYAIANGIVLPKGHGRLVDADEMVKILRESEYYQEKRGDFYGADVTSRVKNFIEDTETVIEADKEVDK